MLPMINNKGKMFPLPLFSDANRTDKKRFKGSLSRLFRITRRGIMYFRWLSCRVIKRDAPPEFVTRVFADDPIGKHWHYARESKRKGVKELKIDAVQQ